MKVWYLAPVVLLLLVGVQTQAQGYRPLPPPERAYLCFEGRNAASIMAKSNELGSRGWKMVSAASHGQSSVWCFEQYQASRQPIASDAD
jgi:hypothetical protein